MPNVRALILSVVAMLATIGAGAAIAERGFVRPLRQEMKRMRFEQERDHARLAQLEAVAAAAPGSDPAPAPLSAPCTDGPALAAMRAAGIGAAVASFARCRPEFDGIAADVAGPPDLVAFAAYTARLVSRHTRYGPSSALSPEEILRAPTIHCTQAAILAAALLRHRWPAAEIEIVNFQTPFMGGHAMVRLREAETELLVDGLAGLVIVASLADLGTARQPAFVSILDVLSHEDRRILRLKRNLHRAVRLRELKPAHVVARIRVGDHGPLWAAGVTGR